MKLSVIIVSYNTSKLTVQAIKSVVESISNSKLLKNQTEIFLIDNNSSDNTLSQINKLNSNDIFLHVIKNDQNLGFATANNQGIKKAKGEYILLLNSDTIVQNHTLDKMIQAFEKFPKHSSSATLSSYHGQLDKLGILASTLLNEDKSHQPQGGSFPNLLSLTSHMLLLDDLPIIGKFLPSTQHTGQSGRASNPPTSKLKLIQKDWVGATAMMIRKEVLDEVGLLDENIFMYGEDIEFCIRAKDHHWDIAIHPEAKIIHLGSASSSAKNALTGEFKAYQYIWAKHKPLWQISFMNTILKAGCYLRILLFGTILRRKAQTNIYKQILHTISD